ncbi:hypothetical protein MPER_07269 [Moniliophthora perniciosa FA553]|nr:hypothetical protein MPER_07269 [Moniliophthora perniciosa FA553]
MGLQRVKARLVLPDSRYGLQHQICTNFCADLNQIGVGFYFVFIQDYGDHEHVFQPIRRWVARQKANFMTLSPEEEKFINAQRREDKPSRDKCLGVHPSSYEHKHK